MMKSQRFVLSLVCLMCFCCCVALALENVTTVSTSGGETKKEANVGIKDIEKPKDAEQEEQEENPQVMEICENKKKQSNLDDEQDGSGMEEFVRSNILRPAGLANEDHIRPQMNNRMNDWLEKQRIKHRMRRSPSSESKESNSKGKQNVETTEQKKEQQHQPEILTIDHQSGDDPSTWSSSYGQNPWGEPDSYGRQFYGTGDTNLNYGVRPVHDSYSGNYYTDKPYQPDDYSQSLANSLFDPNPTYRAN